MNNSEIQVIEVDKLKPNKANPRKINKEKFKKLVTSIKKFPKMLDIRPIVVDENMTILGGNMRYKACLDIGIKEVPVIVVNGLSSDEADQFIIKDNVGYGEWAWETLADEWDVVKLKDWGLDLKNITNTELLSGLEYDPIYYEPKIEPNIELIDCLDLSKYNEKIKALDEYKLSKQQKEILKMFAYRFIKIDFESVANYHSFNATEDEQKAIERLRLVLTDNGINGFIEDDLLRIMGTIEEWTNL